MKEEEKKDCMTIEVSKAAHDLISSLRTSDYNEIVRTDIADSLSTLANLVNAGRDSEEINVWIDDLLKAMYVLGEYNSLVNALYDTSNQEEGCYRFKDKKK